MNYATFWQRFAAMWIDFFILLPLFLLQGWLESFSKSIAWTLVIPMTLAFVAYTVYCHGRFGQTIGKRIMRIRVMRTDGTPIDWRTAWLRSSSDVVFAVLRVIASFVALSAIADSDYYVSGMQRIQNRLAHEPAWLAWTETAAQIWVWSELITMLFNRQRRALHDLIAGTVVAQQKFSNAQAT